MKSFLGADGTGIADVWDAHYIKHNKPGVCVRCQWAKNRLKWEPKLPVLLPGWATSSSASAASARLGSTWVLCSRDTKGTYRFACKGCGDIPAFQVKGKRGSDIQKFQRHQQSSAHMRAILTIIDPTAIGPTGIPVLGAPAPEDFIRVWEAGVPKDLEKIGSRKKVDKLLDCIFEALERRHRAFAASADTITLFRDASQGLLVIRALLCDRKLNQHHVLLGLNRDQGSDAFDITEATEKIIQEFSKPHNKLCSDAEREASQLAMHIRSKIEAVCVDSASNETKSALLMRSSGLTPNLKVIIRDRAHASRRLLSRPWKADPFLNEIAETVVMNSSSICQRIQHSHDLRAMYAANVQQYVPGAFKNSKGLGAAKHRYESWAKPFAMVVMTLPALIRTAEEISFIRVGKQEGKDADDFLNFLNAERVLQLGMMADGSDEAFILIRVFDDEETDPAMQSDELWMFRRRLELLFGARAARCFSLPGYTKAACDFLESRVHVVKQRGKAISTFGGPGSVEQVKQTCLARMQEWAKLCDYIIAAEFPDFDLIHAFWVFNVTGRRAKTGHGYFNDDPAMVAACATERAAVFNRLATAFGVDEVALTEQFNTCLPIARHRATVLGCSNGEAWKFAAKRVARRMTMDSLVTVLQRYLGFGMSTTGVEHTFATVRDALAHRSHADLRKVKRLLVLTRQCPMQDSEFVTTIVREAREIWMTLHSPARHGGKHFDKGVIGVASSSASRAAWLRGRRDCVTKAVHSDNTSVLASIPPMPQQHNAPDELMKEIEFQRDKRRKRKFEAFEFNHLCDDEVDADFEADAAAFFKDRAKKHKQAENKRKLDQKKRCPDHFDLKAVVPYGVHFDVPIDRQQCHRLGANITSSRAEAALFVVERLDPTSIKHYTLWAAMLVGAFVITADAFSASSSSPTAVLKYTAAVVFWRRVYITDVFKHKHPRLVEIVHAVCQKPDSRWQILDTIETINAEWRSAKKKRKAGQVVVLASNGEHVVTPAKVMTFQQFQSSINKVDATRTVSSSEAARVR